MDLQRTAPDLKLCSYWWITINKIKKAIDEYYKKKGEPIVKNKLVIVKKKPEIDFNQSYKNNLKNLKFEKKLNWALSNGLINQKQAVVEVGLSFSDLIAI